MWKKKMAAWGATSMLLAALAVMPVSAAPADSIADSICDECKVTGCTQTGYHIHNKKIYCGYTHEKGYCDGSCDAVGTCGVVGCNRSGEHTHNNGHHNTQTNSDNSSSSSGNNSSSSSESYSSTNVGGGHHGGHHGGRHHGGHHGGRHH